MKKLTGAGNLFHSALDKAAGMLKRKVGTGMEFMQELGKIPGVKKEEIEDRKLHEVAGMPKMTREQFLSELQNRPVPAVKEKVWGEQLSPQELRKETNNFIRAQARRYASNNSDNSREYRVLAGDEMRRLRNNPEVPEYVANVVKQDDLPEHEKWTLPGGENYREMLIKPPKGMEEFPGVEIHFRGEPNILASMRLKDRTGPNGEKLLHLEELQSDWHQQGREKGYHDPEKLAQAEAKINALKAEHKRLGEVKALAQTPEEREAISEQRLAIMGEIRDATIMPSDHVPDAPFKKNWEEMALKRLIHHAAENGYHGIVVTPGAEQADRYSLANVIDEINVIGRTHAGTGEQTRTVALDTVDGKSLRLGVNNNGVVDNVSDPTIQNFMGKNLSEVVGKDVAKNIMSGGTQTISGAGLTIGDKAMKKFYDEKVPNILNSIGKKYGAKTQLHGHAIEVGEKMVPDRAGLGMIRSGEPDQKQLHHFPITEDMRQDVLQNGLPLYAEGGEVHAEDDPESCFFPKSKE